MKIGFTGTQYGMTERQVKALSILLGLLTEHKRYEMHHGGCIGADWEFHNLVQTTQVTDFITHIHWGDNPHKRMDMTGHQHSNVLQYEPKSNLERNKDIAIGKDLLIAAPKTVNEELRSGTWATVRYARKAGVPVIILDP